MQLMCISCLVYTLPVFSFLKEANKHSLYIFSAKRHKT